MIKKYRANWPCAYVMVEVITGESYCLFTKVTMNIYFLPGELFGGILMVITGKICAGDKWNPL